MRNFNVWDEKIEMKTKNNTAHDFGRLSDVISHRLFNRLHQSQVDARLFLYLYYTKTSKFFKQCDFLHIPFLFPYRLWYTLCVESFKAVAISIKAGDAYGHLFKIYRKKVAFCQSMKL